MEGRGGEAADRRSVQPRLLFCKQEKLGLLEPLTCLQRASHAHKVPDSRSVLVSGKTPLRRGKEGVAVHAAALLEPWPRAPLPPDLGWRTGSPLAGRAGVYVTARSPPPRRPGRSCPPAPPPGRPEQGGSRLHVPSSRHQVGETRDAAGRTSGPELRLPDPRRPSSLRPPGAGRQPHPELRLLARCFSSCEDE